VALAGCGYVGDPLPPALHIPRAVTDLSAVQVGDSILVRFTIPSLTTDNVGLRRLGGIELQFNDRTIAVDESEPGPVEVQAPLADWVGGEVRISVRVASDRGRWSTPSNAAILTAIPRVDPPAGLTAASDPAGLKLRWTDRPGGRVRVHRMDPMGELAVAGEAAGGEWVDTQAVHGTESAYRVQMLTPAGSGFAESELSPVIRFTPVDQFAPSTPAGLTAITGITTIELAWERSPEADTVGYFVYRGTGEDALTRISESLPAASFSDRDVRAGVSYRYAVTAVDDKGNESARSAVAAVTAPP
jgi:hypothetical protein